MSRVGKSWGDRSATHKIFTRICWFGIFVGFICGLIVCNESPQNQIHPEKTCGFENELKPTKNQKIFVGFCHILWGFFRGLPTLDGVRRHSVQKIIFVPGTKNFKINSSFILCFAF
jgi:hypothetical protein